MPRICPTCRQRVTGICSTCDTTAAGTPRRPRRRDGYGRNEARRRADTVRVHVEQFGWVCPGWQKPAHPAEKLTADHVLPTGRGGDPSGPLRVLCRSCNSSRQASLDTPIVPGLLLTLVCGPGGAGKNTYVREQALPSDLVIDYDAIARALQPTGAEAHHHVESHAPFVCEARDAVLDRLVLGNHTVRRAWVIHTGAKREVRERFRRRYGARVVVILASEEMCLQRVMGERPQQWWGYVRAWFEAYEPDPRDTVIKQTR